MKRVLVLGSGPIIIGQAAEFDYSGSQACKSLKEEGIDTILVNSNPATIMTDLDIGGTVYIEPLNLECVTKIIDKERPDAILPTMGGQTALNLAEELHKAGVLDRFNVKMLGTPVSAIEDSEDREKFKAMMERLGEPVPKSFIANALEDALSRELKYPVILRPAFTLGGTGGGIVHNEQELRRILPQGLARSIIHQVLVEECVLGWYEFEYEVMRDGADNCIVICSMENLDPMGVHTGESIVVAPAQTLRDNEHQTLRSAAIRIIRALGIEGGCNVQFAVNPKNFEYKVIEVNPRVSRSSALASKATGYPIAKVSAKIAAGKRLDGIMNTVTGSTPASFEPALDYIVVKIPRWPFDKFRSADRVLGTQMKSTGEVMGIGRTFEEALQKAIRSLDIKRQGICADGRVQYTDKAKLTKFLKVPTDNRIFSVYDALSSGFTVNEISLLSGINPFFISKIRRIRKIELQLKKKVSPGILRIAKQAGFTDRQISISSGLPEGRVKEMRESIGLAPAYKMVDTCAAEFDARTPYYYSSWERESESFPSANRKVVIIGAGPIRIGQGIEFDYCCVHGSMALKEAGVDSILINNNPETVSTDSDCSTKLYFEPLLFEDVLNVLELEKPDGVIVQFGGQTSINIAEQIKRSGFTILGTSAESINIAEDRYEFAKCAESLGIPLADWGTARTFEEASIIAQRIGYPVLVRPSYVLGGAGMEIVNGSSELSAYIAEAAKVSSEHPILIDKYLQDSIEVDVDAVSDGNDVYIGGIMEHIEYAGVHSGDAAMVLPPQTLPKHVLDKIREHTFSLARRLRIIGLMNIQFAVKSGIVYCLEVNPRASRTIPFVSKVINVQLAKLATRVMLGRSLRELGFAGEGVPKGIAVKEVVFPFYKLPGVDVVLGPEMKSTGEVMGISDNFGTAFYKAFTAAGSDLPLQSGKVFITVRDSDKPRMIPIARDFVNLGFELLATPGTAKALGDERIPVTEVNKISQGSPSILDSFESVSLVINTPTIGRNPKRDGYAIRRACIESNKPYITTVTGARAVVEAIKAAKGNSVSVKSLNEYYSEPN